MIKRCVFWIEIAALALVACSSVVTAEDTDECRIVRELFYKRANIIGEIMKSNISFCWGEMQLRQIEEEAMLKKDIENIRSYADSDWEPLAKVQVDSICRRNNVNGLKNYELEVSWWYFDRDCIHRESCVYNVCVSSKNNKTKMANIGIK